ncbi:MAG: ABC transporter permease [Deltaproteobacteria bacterium]|nr:ABC transporter permease [Deltaproteobacteria bacterium]
MTPPTGFVQERLAGLGRPVLAGLREGRALAALFLQTFAAILRGRVRARSFLLQCYLIGNKSVPFVAITLGVLGLISVYQVATQIEQIIPDFTMLGAAFLQMMIREFAPTITGLMVATRVGSGIAAEIGSMVVTEQVDALRMSNADPVDYLLVPRTLASGLMMLMLTILGVVCATIAGMLIARSGFGVPYATFLNLQLIDAGDLALGGTKALAYGLAIPVIAGHAGLSASGGSAGVGRATTQAVVATSFAVIVLDFIISGLSYLLFGQ